MVLVLILGIKARKRLVRENPEALTVPQDINQVWTMDLMHDQLEDGRIFRLLYVIDDFNQVALSMKINNCLTLEPAIRVIKQLISRRYNPEECLVRQCIKINQ
jgi:putative transposase